MRTSFVVKVRCCLFQKGKPFFLVLLCFDDFEDPPHAFLKFPASDVWGERKRKVLGKNVGKLIANKLVKRRLGQLGVVTLDLDNLGHPRSALEKRTDWVDQWQLPARQGGSAGDTPASPAARMVARRLRGAPPQARPAAA